MKNMKYLGCLLALVFAGASAFAGTWFSNVVGESLGTGWSNTTGWTWKDGAGSYNNWTAPLTYTRSDDAQPLASKDSTITTSVKFTAMDAEDLAEQTIGDDVKGGLTVVEIAGDTPTLSYYGIVNDAGTKKWMPLTGVTPTLDKFVTVTVELKNNLDNTYTISYKVGDPAVALTVADASFTMATASAATISTVEYLGQFSLESLAGATWFNPCTVSPSITGIASVKAYDANIEPLQEYALNAIPRGATVNFAFEAANNYSALVKVASYTTTGEAATEAVTWENYVVATQMPTGTDTPSKITVDAAEVASRVEGGAKGGENYLFTEQDNGQLGWVNYTLGIADDAMIAPTNGAPVKGSVAINFGIDPELVAPGASVTYTVGGVAGKETPNIALADTKTSNNKIVEVTMVLKDEGGESHAIKTAQVGVMETGKTVDPDAKKEYTTYDIVAVPWTAFDGGDITVANLLNTAMLTDEDVLYVQKESNGDAVEYDQYTLAEGKWTSAVGTTAAADRKLEKGTAIWIERSNKSRIVFMGAPKVEETAPVAYADAGKWTLIANPSIKDFKIDAVSALENAVNGDKIIVEDVADPRQYELKDGVWGYTKIVKNEDTGRTRRERITTDNVIGAGIGFWYVSVGTEKDVKITFPAND